MVNNRRSFDYSDPRLRLGFVGEIRIRLSGSLALRVSRVKGYVGDR